MLVCFISDVHANLYALSSLEDVLGQADQVVCLGDLVGYYAQPEETVQRMRDFAALCILGNHDHYVLRGCPEHLPESVRWGVDYAARQLSEQSKAWLSSLPTMWQGFLGGESVLLTHGAPWDNLHTYLYADSPQLARLRDYRCDLLVFGHTHRSLLEETGKPRLLNPGSVGQSRDAIGESCAALWDTERGTIERIRRRYDTAPVMELARARGAGDWIGKHLSGGEFRPDDSVQ